MTTPCTGPAEEIGVTVAGTVGSRQTERHGQTVTAVSVRLNAFTAPVEIKGLATDTRIAFALDDG